MSEGETPTTTEPQATAKNSRLKLRNPWLSMLIVFILLISLLVTLELTIEDLDETKLGDLGVLVVAALALTLAGWRFGLEDRQASAALRLAEAAQKQADAAENQIRAAQEQADAAKEQNKLAEKQFKGSKDLAQAAQRQETIAQEQAKAAEELASAAKQQVEAATSAAEAAKNHADAARKRAETNDQALLLERYHRAARMLGDGVQAVRIGGVSLLDRLAKDKPKDYHVEAMTLFASFVRHPDIPAADAAVDFRRLRADVQAVVDVLCSREDSRREYEEKKDFVLDLTRANLRDANLQNADLRSAKLQAVSLEGADLTGARLEGADLGGARLDGATVAEAIFASPDGEVHNLTQDQLDSCSREAANEPVGLDRLRLKWTRATQ